MDVKERFGSAVRRYRRELGMSQEDLAAAVDLDQGYISLIETGQMNVTLETADRVAQALKKDIGEMW